MDVTSNIFRKHYTCFSIQQGLTTRYYKPKTENWFKEEIRYENGNLKQVTKIHSFCKKFLGFEITGDKLKYWNGKNVKQYYENGNLKSNETFCENQKVEWQYYYHNNGKLESKVFYMYASDFDTTYCNKIISEGLHGTHKYYHYNGKIKSLESYSYGKLHGIKKCYDINGIECLNELYFSGKLMNKLV